MKEFRLYAADYIEKVRRGMEKAGGNPSLETIYRTTKDALHDEMERQFRVESRRT